MDPTKRPDQPNTEQPTKRQC